MVYIEKYKEDPEVKYCFRIKINLSAEEYYKKSGLEKKLFDAYVIDMVKNTEEYKKCIQNCVGKEDSSRKYNIESFIDGLPEFHRREWKQKNTFLYIGERLITMILNFNYNFSLPELQEYNDDDLYEIFICSDRDRKELYRAACTYFMCIMEINRRNDGFPPEQLNVKCIANIYNPDGDIIFQFGNEYRMYAIDDVMLVYDVKWIPYIFSIVEEDSRYIWKCFRLVDNELFSKYIQ